MTLPRPSDPDSSPDVPISDAEIRQHVIGFHRKIRNIEGNVEAIRVALVGSEYGPGALAKQATTDQRVAEIDRIVIEHDKTLERINLEAKAGIKTTADLQTEQSKLQRIVWMGLGGLAVVEFVGVMLIEVLKK